MNMNMNMNMNMKNTHTTCLICMLILLTGILLAVTPGENILAATLKVGPSRTYTVPSEAAAVANDGDIVEIDAGLYHGDVATWTADNLTLRGVGGMVHLNASGVTIPNQKAIWVIQGNNTTVEHIEFSGAKVSDHNGAGIRQEGNNLIVRYCYFHHNENGILESNKPNSEILIEYSEFAYQGYGDGYSHNIYIGNAKKFTLRYSYSHHSLTGHLVKSRAAENHIMYNRLTDEWDGTSSYVLNLPNGGRSYVIGNVMHQGPQSPNNKLLSFAEEGASNPLQELYVSGNTFVNDRSNGTAIRMKGTPVIAIMNNIFDGFSRTVDGSFQGPFLHNLETTDAKFADRTNYDYHLTTDSLAINVGAQPGSAQGVSLVPVYEYVHPTNAAPRNIVGTIDVGAYEYQEQTVETYMLSVSVTGDGSGSVLGLTVNEPCETACSAEFQEGTVVALIAQPNADSDFGGWSGACSGNDECAIVMESNMNVIATFTLNIADADGDGVANDVDNCPTTPNLDQSDGDGDGIGDFCESCPADPHKVEPGTCGCGVADIDSDGDDTPDCLDTCPADPNKVEPGICGCGIVDSPDCGIVPEDSDNDGIPDTQDNCPATPNTDQADTDLDGEGDACDIPSGGVTLEKAQFLAQDRGANGSILYVNRGDTVSYTLTAQNVFDTPLTLVLTDALNALVEYVSGTLQVNGTNVGDAFVSSSGWLEYTAAEVGVNDVVTIAFDVMVKSDAAYDAVIANVATISAYAPWLQDAVVRNQASNGVYAQVVAASSGNPVPEPSTVALFGIGLLGLFAAFRKRQKSR